MSTSSRRTDAENLVDTVTTDSGDVVHSKLQARVRGTKAFLLTFWGFLYLIYFLWCMVLLAVFPTSTGEMLDVARIGAISCVVTIGVLLIMGLLLLQRIAKADVSIATRQRSLFKLIIMIIPGLLISIIVPFMVLRDPPFSIDTVPSNAQEFVAPLSVTLNVERSVTVLQKLGYRPVQFIWDTNGDGKPDENTVVPMTTVVYDRAGAYTAVVGVVMADKSMKKISRALYIRSEMFTIEPQKPVLERPATFSIAQLLTDAKLLKSVKWDFDGDNKVDQETKTPSVTYTYFSLGTYNVSAVVTLTNQTQKSYQRKVTVIEPPPLPFPITLKTDPKQLVGPAPFGVLFSLETKEPLRDATWTFAPEKEEEHGTRIGHAFNTSGVYTVLVKVRSASGSLAELSATVRATEKLAINDLQFVGTPDVKTGTVTGDAPLTVQLTPKTSLPLVVFSWEYPDDMEATVTGTTFQAICRREGIYNISLMALGPNGSSMRMPIKINVATPLTEPAFSMKPESGTSPLHVVFDASETYIPPEEQIAGFKWLFGDEAQAKIPELGASRAEHTFDKPGEYKVTLFLVMVSGKEYKAERTIIVRKPSLSACATASRTTVGVGKGVAFDSACSTGTPSSLLWDVRSKQKPNLVLAQSSDAKYVQVFDKPGEYVVTLSLTDASGYTDSKSISITVTP